MKASSFTPRRLKLGIIALPMLLASLYFAFIASDRYVSQSIIAVRSALVAPTAFGGVSSFGTGTGLLAWEDTLYLLDYIRSDGILRELDPKLNLRKHFEAPRADVFVRLPSDASHEWFRTYFNASVSLEFSDLNGLLTVRTQGFDAATAQAINRAILESCERFVNDFSHRVAREQMRFSQSEADDAAKRLEVAKAKVVEFQRVNKILDPAAQQSSANALIGELQATIARLEADLKSKLAYLQPDAPAVTTVREQIAANRAQLDLEKSRTTSTQSGDRLGALSVEYHNLVLEAGFAEDAYKSAVAVLQSARIEAAQKLKSLIIVDPPSKAETAEYPSRFYDLLTLLALCIMVYTVVRLSVAAIQEHQD